VVAAPFARRLLDRVDRRKLTVSGIVMLLVAALAFLPVLHNSTAMLVTNFFVLSIFFLLEGSWDALLATFANTLSPVESDKLNARQSVMTQAGLMLGGLPIGYLSRLGGPSTPFIAAALLYLLTISLFAMPSMRRALPGNASTGTTQQPTGRASMSNPIAWTVLVALALVWPCLALVNMVVPLVASRQGGGTVEHAAVLDAAIGLGMAFVGIVYERIVVASARVQRIAIVGLATLIPLPFVALLLVHYHLALFAGCFFLCGMGFGLVRIHLRKHLIATQPSHRVGQIVASCNGYGFPVLAVTALLYAWTWLQGPLIPLVVFIVFAIVGSCAALQSRREYTPRHKPLATHSTQPDSVAVD
jgi:MFS family permease